MKQVIRVRWGALVVAGAVAAAGSLAGAVATASASVCVDPVMGIQSPANLAPSKGVVTVHGTADSTTAVTFASLTPVSGTVSGAPIIASIGATSGGAPTVYPITASFDTTTVADGLYTLELRASTPACTFGGVPAKVDILADNTAPALSFSSGPADGATLADAAGATFAVAAATDLTGVSLQCAYDTAALAACTGTVKPPSLAPGTHSFRVVGTDGAGNASAIARSFTIATPPAPAPVVEPPSADDTPKAKPSCRVPRLRGLTLTAARKKLVKAHCRLGRTTRPPARVLRLDINRGQKLVVQRQSERAGRKLPNGQRVGVALVPKRDLKLG